MASLLENLLSYVHTPFLIISLILTLILVAVITGILRFHVRKYSTRNMRVQSMQLLYLGGLGFLTLLALIFLAFSL